MRLQETGGQTPSTLRNIDAMSICLSVCLSAHIANSPHVLLLSFVSTAPVANRQLLPFSFRVA
jgi:hypothetical protein